MYTYTFIIPHKNLPHLLQRCLDSIPRREDIQIVIVDDNSTEANVNFDSFPGKNQPNVECVFSKEGKGAGHARNLGIERAKGKWILFADADDYYSSSLLEYLDSVRDSEVDVIYFGVHCVDIETGKSVAEYQYINKDIEDFQTSNEAECSLRYSNWVPWNKMISRDLILQNNLKYEEIPVGNDAMFILQVGAYARNIGVIKHPLYVYNIRKNSLSFKSSYRADMERLALDFRINRFYKEHCQERFVYTVIPRLFVILQNHGWLYFCENIPKVLSHSFFLSKDIFYLFRYLYRYIFDKK